MTTSNLGLPTVDDSAAADLADTINPILDALDSISASGYRGQGKIVAPQTLTFDPAVIHLTVGEFGSWNDSSNLFECAAAGLYLVTMLATIYNPDANAHRVRLSLTRTGYSGFGVTAEDWIDSLHTQTLQAAHMFDCHAGDTLSLTGQQVAESPPVPVRPGALVRVGPAWMSVFRLFGTV